MALHPIDQQRLIEQRLEALNGYQKHYTKPFSCNKMKHVLHCIDEHLFDVRLNVEWVLQKCEIKSHAFLTQFKQHHHMTIRKYIEYKRMHLATQLLELEELEISTIAFCLGYENYRTFGRAFQRSVGCSPSAFRAECWSTERDLLKL